MKKRTARLLAVASTMLAFAAPSALAAPVLAPSAPPATSSPVIGFVGQSEVGADYTCTSGAWIGNNPTFAYEWRRDGTPIAGANRDNYVTVPADFGTLITCRVTATDNTGSTAEESDAESPNTAPARTRRPATTGRATATDNTGSTAEESDAESPNTAPATTGLTQFSTRVTWRHFPIIPVGASLLRNGVTVTSIPEATVDGSSTRDADFSPQNAPADTRDAVEFT